MALDADGLAVGRTWALDFEPSDLVFDPDHDLMFAGAGASAKIAELRMSSGDVLVEHPTGSPGRKFGQGLANTLVAIFYAAAAAGGAPVSGDLPFRSGGNTTSMLLRADGAILYVLNRYTSDISVFDVAKQDVVDIVPTGGGSQRIVQLPGDPDFWVQSRENLAHFDTSTNSIDRTIDFQGGVSCEPVSLDTARERAWICKRRMVLVFDLRTGRAVGAAALPKFASFLWIDNPRQVEPEAPHP